MTLDVFVGEPSVLTSAQRSVSDRWHVRLLGAGCDVRVVHREDYQPDPWQGLRDRLTTADGALILGFAQLTIRYGTWRPGTEEEAPLASSWTSPWLHAELGMAIALGLPVLLAAEAPVREGAFCPDAWVGHVFGTPAASPDEGVVDEWLAEVYARSRTRVVESPATTFMGACPRPLAVRGSEVRQENR